MSDWANQLIDRVTNAVPQIDLDALAQVPQEKFREFLKALSPEDRAQIVGWAKAATEIRDDQTLSRKDKEKRVLALDTTATLFHLLRALLDVVAQRAPEAHRGMVRNGIGIAAVAAAGLNFEITGLALIVMRAALPAFVLGESGGKFCAFVLANE